MHFFERLTFNNDLNTLLLLGKDCQKIPTDHKKLLFKQYVEIINLELSSFCNRKCNYCPVSDSLRSKEQSIIETNMLEKVIAELKAIDFDKRLSLNLYNEPLENPLLVEQILKLRTALPRVYISFNSNGDRLTYEKLTNLKNAGLNQMTITLHPPANQLDSAEKKLYRIKKLLTKLRVDFENFELTKEKILSQESIEFLSLGVLVRIQWVNWNVKGSSRGGSVESMVKREHVRNLPCAKPFREFTIYYDGTVTPCCEVFYDANNKTIINGNVATQTIFDVYLSKSLSHFRKSVFDFSEKTGVCRHCTVGELSSLDERPERDRIINLLS